MIPPVTPGQSDEKHNMVGWKNTFNMRQVSLINLATTQLTIKNGTKLNIPNHRRAYSVTSPTKSLDLLRKNLQSSINKDIDNVLKKYIDKFFQPAINNIKNNLGQDSVNEDNIREVCKQMLEEAKSMYKYCEDSRDSSPYECSQSEAESENSVSDSRYPNMEKVNSLHPSKRKDSDDSDLSSNPTPVFKRHRNRMTTGSDYIGCKLSLKRDGPKWNPERIKTSTMFIMGARANKVLGYGQTRGRLYVRHPNLVRYSGDQEDKEWLASQNLMPPSGGKAYLMLLEDIKELTDSEEYKHSPNLQLQELQGFEVPLFLLNKIKTFIEYVRSERKLLAVLDMEDGTNTSTPPSNVAIQIDSGPSTPCDSLDNNPENIWKTSQLRQQIDYPNMSSDMSSLSSSVISSILSGNYNGSGGIRSYSDNAQSF
ncbi:deoxynucleotidyltransferase terminal-interacting protein 1 [Cylas formicarius]|uniref:deoxynucleotidyltransferase terminal-interacting protein 1 n=1 Tax=Cylas formicarius TaxID=197179 RepID=UPI0029588122|nr:deoxynucleotidyltransferase terminal-interacting protein 1 [Cylas formicarius]XP_060527855.1 deoxynucleotidyltransferase terminal-interacting protein 1 [Cylas formicarius]XP_060527856.1 deoxynucleotidyltransferase terminal-interacting protein 1 [Cylas formicarius]